MVTNLISTAKDLINAARVKKGEKGVYQNVFPIYRYSCHYYYYQSEIGVQKSHGSHRRVYCACLVFRGICASGFKEHFCGPSRTTAVAIQLERQCPPAYHSCFVPIYSCALFAFSTLFPFCQASAGEPAVATANNVNYFTKAQWPGYDY